MAKLSEVVADAVTSAEFDLTGVGFNYGNLYSIQLVLTGYTSGTFNVNVKVKGSDTYSRLQKVTPTGGLAVFNVTGYYDYIQLEPLTLVGTTDYVAYLASA